MDNANYRELKSLLVEETRLFEKAVDIDAKIKVAKRKSDHNQLNDLLGQADVIRKLFFEANFKIATLCYDTDKKQTLHEQNFKKLYAYSLTSLLASSISIFMPEIVSGVVWFVTFLAMAIYLKSKADDEQAYASGLSEDEWAVVKAKVAKEHHDREALAKSIAKELKKRA